MQVADVVALVTGGASGMGEGTARMIVDAGGRVAIVDLPASNGAGLAAELGANAEFFPADVTSPDEVVAAVDGAVDSFGRVDLCVNCAGVADAARVLSHDGVMFPLDLYARVVAINLVGLFDVVRNAARAMSRNEAGPDGERGVIVNVASIAGYEGQAGQAAYAGSKGGVIAMTLPLARDLASHGIRVNTICPGIFDTAMLAAASDSLRERLMDIHVFPKRLGTAADFAHLVRSIAENRMINGEVIRLDAGTRLAHGAR